MRKRSREPCAESLEPLRREVGRRAAAQVKLHDVSAPRETRADSQSISRTRTLEVGVIGEWLLPGDDDRAAAEVAELFAEGQMEVERKRRGALARFDSSITLS